MTRKLPIGSIIGKVWGTTQAIFQNEATEVQILTVKKGWQCSEHAHLHKQNRFYVISGQLKVRVFKDGLEDETILNAGEMTDVNLRDRHQFIALTDCRLIEIYWVCLDPDDIERHSKGGKS